MQRKTVLTASGICLMLIMVFISVVTARGQYMPLELHYTTASDFEKGTTALFNYTVKFDDEYKGYIAPKTQMTLMYIKRTVELIDDGKRLQYTFDTLDIRNWEVEMDANGVYSSTFELTVPTDDSVSVSIIATNGTEFTFGSIGFDRKSNIPGKEHYLKKTQDSSPPDKYKEPSIEDLTPEQLQTEYDVVIDLRDTSKIADATRILGEIPAGKELVKHAGGFRMKISLANLFKLAKAGIDCTFLNPPSWVRQKPHFKDSTEIQTVEDIDGQSVIPGEILVFSIFLN